MFFGLLNKDWWLMLAKGEIIDNRIMLRNDRRKLRDDPEL